MRRNTIPAESRAVFRFLELSYVLLATGLTSTTALANLRERIAMSDTVTSLHGGFFGWGLVVLALSSQRLGERVRRSTLMSAGIGGLGIGSALFGLATNVAMSLSGALLLGLGAALLVVSIPAVVATNFPANRSEVFTKLNVAPSFGGMGIPLLLSVCSAAGLTWRLPILAFGPLLAVGIVVMSRGLRSGDLLDLPDAHVHHASSGNRWRLFGYRAFRVRWIVQTIQIGAEFATGAWVVVFAREQAGFSRAAAPLLAVAWGGGMLVARSTTPRLIRRLGTRLEPVAFVFITLSLVLLLIVHAPVVTVLATFATAASFGPMYTLGVDRMYVTAAQAGIHDSDAVSSLAALSSGIAVTLGPVIIGAFADQVGLRRALWLPVVVTAGCAVLGLARWAGELSMLGHADSPAAG